MSLLKVKGRERCLPLPRQLSGWWSQPMGMAQGTVGAPREGET